ncbi:MAG: acetate kinase [Gammaproteobacteria bacterium HGW-Gammaproteobacteria-3]|nr:MAG: acetate kinase [Gammaproteobacteria bacterium HGW-Gammaproteobacteria-3]
MAAARLRGKAAEDTVLVINSGSSSIKYQLLALPSETVLLNGLVEGIGGDSARHGYDWLDGSGQRQERILTLPKPDHQQGFSAMSAVLSDTRSVPTVIGHRVVHGGERFVQPTRIDPAVLDAIEQLSALAPLHNPANVLGIRVCLELFPQLPQIAVFDTAFHQTIPAYAHRYAVPEAWYREFGIRRYGFHGSSHRFVAQKAADFLQQPLDTLNLITLHLGNGASASAIANGVCVDTSMGFTPLEGLVMGTRCGDIDASIALAVQQKTGMSAAQVDNQLNHCSGLFGMTGTQDMRTLLKRCEQGDESADLAFSLYCYRIKKYIGAYLAVLGRVDAIIFTGGVGENAAAIRSRSCKGLKELGIVIDNDLNNQAVTAAACISQNDSPIRILAIRTHEELQIALEAIALAVS